MIKKGTRVTLSPMWKYDKAAGCVIKTTKDYTVVKWDGINGEWHYTQDQAQRLELEHDK
jgi:hypothetical protein